MGLQYCSVPRTLFKSCISKCFVKVLCCLLHTYHCETAEYLLFGLLELLCPDLEKHRSFCEDLGMVTYELHKYVCLGVDQQHLFSTFKSLSALMWWYAVLPVSAGASDRSAGLRRWISRHGRLCWRHESALRIGSFGLRDVRCWSLRIHVVRGFFLCFSSLFLQAVQEGIFVRLDLFLRF